MAKSTRQSKLKNVETDSSEVRLSVKLRGKDFHPEIIGSWSKKRLELLKMKRKQRKLKRTAMGEYIPSPNKSPLTIAAVPTPSAFVYHPNVQMTLKSSPKFTIAKRYRVWKKDPTPGPAEYGKLEDFYTKCKAPTMKARPFWFTHLAKEKKYQKVSPNSYVLRSTLRANAAIVSSRPPSKTNKGMLPSYPYPPAGSENTAGFYGTQPSFEKGVKFGIIPKPLTKDEFPGPIFEVPPIFPEGLKFRLHGRLPWPPKIQGWDAPAPNSYWPESDLGKGDKYPRVTARLPSVIQGNKVGPGPHHYLAFKPKLGVPKTMSHLPLPSRFPRQPMPAPNSYTIEPLLLPKEVKTKKSEFKKQKIPKPRIRGPKIIGRQETMITLRHSAVDNPPPTSIHLCYFKEKKFGLDAPGARIRSRPIEKDERKIAPNKYHPCTNPKLKRIPAYTFGHKIAAKTEPLTINVDTRPLPSTLALKNQFTFGTPLTHRVSDIPSPAKYSVPSTFDWLKRSKPPPGASLKGRRTPFALPGIAKLKTPVTPTRSKARSRNILDKK